MWYAPNMWDSKKIRIGIPIAYSHSYHFKNKILITYFNLSNSCRHTYLFNNNILHSYSIFLFLQTHQLLTDKLIPSIIIFFSAIYYFKPLIFFDTDTPITSKKDSSLQYFWEAFPAGSGKSDRTTYLFTYMDAKNERPSIAEVI